MAKQSFKFYTPRDKPKKRGPRQHKKNKNKQEKRQKTKKIQRPGLTNLYLIEYPIIAVKERKET